MANELQTKLDAILEDKNTNLLPEHLKAGVTCLGIDGTLESGGIQTLTITDPEIPGFTPSYSVTNVTTDYGFVLDGGVYKNNNQGVDYSIAECKVTVNTPHEFVLKLICTQDSESGFDYGMVSGIDSAVYDTSFQSLAGDLTTEFTVPAGEHYFYVKYLKDGSATNGTDTFTFMLDFSNCTGSPEATYTVNVTHFATKEDMLADTECPVNTYAIVYGYGRELVSEVWCKKETGWVFTGVGNDPNFLGKNIARGVKIGEYIGGYIPGYTLNDDGTATIRCVTNAVEFNVNNHINSLRIISAYLDQYNMVHVTIQYETYDEIPVTFNDFYGNILNFNVPDSEGVTSTIEIVCASTINVINAIFNALANLTLNLTWTSTDLPIEYAEGVTLPSTTSISAQLMYNEHFNIYKATMNCSDSGTYDNNKYIGIYYVDFTTGIDSALQWESGSGTSWSSDNLTFDEPPTAIQISKSYVYVTSDSSSQNYETVIDNVSYNYYIYACCGFRCWYNGSCEAVMWTDASGFTQEGQYINYDVIMTCGETSVTESISVENTNQINKSISLDDGVFDMTTLLTMDPSVTVTNNTVELIQPEDVLVAETWLVYNHSGIQIDTISNLVVHGSYIHGYTMSGTLTYENSFTFYVYKDNTKSDLLVSGNQTSTSVGWAFSLPKQEYDFNNLYIVMVRNTQAVDSQYYDPENTNVTIQEDGSAINNLTYTDEVHGFSVALTLSVNDLSSPSYGGSMMNVWTITDNAAFAQYVLSDKGYEAYNNGETLDLVFGEDVDTYNLFDKDGNVLTLNSHPNLIGQFNSTKTSLGTSTGNSPGEVMLAAYRFEVVMKATMDNTEPVVDDGTLVKCTDTDAIWYDNGTMYKPTYTNAPIYEFTDKGDGGYNKTDLIAAYSTGSSPWCRYFDSDYNEFTDKYAELHTGNYHAFAQIDESVYQSEITEVIVTDNIHNTYILGTYNHGYLTSDPQLTYTYDGSEYSTRIFVTIENNPLFDNVTVYWTEYKGIVTVADNNATIVTTTE